MPNQKTNSDSFLKQTSSQLLREQETLRRRREALAQECAKPPAMRFGFTSPFRSRSHNSRSPVPDLQASKSQQGLRATSPPYETSMESTGGRSRRESKGFHLPSRASRLRQPPPPMQFSLSYRPSPIAVSSHSLKHNSISPIPKEGNFKTPTSALKASTNVQESGNLSRKRLRSRSHLSDCTSSESQKKAEVKRRLPRSAFVDVPVQIFAPPPKQPAAEEETPPRCARNAFPLPHYSPSQAALERFSNVLQTTPEGRAGGPAPPAEGGAFATPRQTSSRLARRLSPLAESAAARSSESKSPAPTPQRVLSSMQILSEKCCRGRPDSSPAPTPVSAGEAAPLRGRYLRADRPTPASISCKAAAAGAGSSLTCSVSPLLTTEHIARSIQVSTESKRPPPPPVARERQGGECEAPKDTTAEPAQPSGAKGPSAEVKQPDTPRTNSTLAHVVDGASVNAGAVVTSPNQLEEELFEVSQPHSASSPVISKREIAASVLASADKRCCQRPTPDSGRVPADGAAFDNMVSLIRTDSECASASPQITSEGFFGSLAVLADKPNRGAEQAMERCDKTSSTLHTVCSEDNSRNEQTKSLRMASPSPTGLHLQASLEVSADKRNALLHRGTVSNSPSRCTPYRMLGLASPLQTNASGYASPTHLGLSEPESRQGFTSTASLIPPHELETHGSVSQPNVPPVKPTLNGEQLKVVVQAFGSPILSNFVPRERKEDENRHGLPDLSDSKGEGSSPIVNSTLNFSGRDPFLDYAYLEERLKATKSHAGTDENALTEEKRQHALKAGSLGCAEDDNAVAVKNDYEAPMNSETHQDPSAGGPHDQSFLPPQFYQLEKDIKAISEGRPRSGVLARSPIPNPRPKVDTSAQVGRGSIMIPHMKEGGHSLDAPPSPTAEDNSVSKPPRCSSLLLVESSPCLPCYAPLQEPHRPLSMPCRSNSPLPIQIPRTLVPPPPLPRPLTGADLDFANSHTRTRAGPVLADKEARVQTGESPVPAQPSILPDSQRARASLSQLPRPVSLSSQVPRSNSYHNSSAIVESGSAAYYGRPPLFESAKKATVVPPARRQGSPLPISLSPQEGRSTPYPRGSTILTVNSAEDDKGSDIISVTSDGDNTLRGTKSDAKVDLRTSTVPSQGGNNAIDTLYALGDVQAQNARFSPPEGSKQLKGKDSTGSIDWTPAGVSSALLSAPQSREVSSTTDNQSASPRTTRHSVRSSQMESRTKLPPNDAIAAIEQSISKRTTGESTEEAKEKPTGVESTPSPSDVQIPSLITEASTPPDSIAQRIVQNPRTKDPYYSYDTYIMYLSQLDRTSAKKIRRKAGKRMQKRIERDVLVSKTGDKRKAADSARAGRLAKRTKAEATGKPFPSPVLQTVKVDSKDDNNAVVFSPATSMNSQPQNRKPHVVSRASEEQREATITRGGTPNKPTRRLFESPSAPSSRMTLTENEEKAPQRNSTGSDSTDIQRRQRGRRKGKMTKTGAEPTSPANELYTSGPKPISIKATAFPSQKKPSRHSLVADEKENLHLLHPKEHSFQKKKKHRKGAARFSDKETLKRSDKL